ncbi:sugar nucleotide-binding protein [Mycolicibacterium austroafricanum]|uniref:sugar nucleotide-binding protein n=1 Tax=Mycolicibacterium austroafricanum TaxID=39687 RepID=UPI001CA3728C|nr:bifunctional dTDP-4-dehydrorhamnose 3,5-epimerase family protein/NAD(P)-dependent oxidoreductase [Mycolicibacterium austroafricanum]QZT58433.1 bifunctional dTDP-4-dehydrorhamnose 3,5-epimerase family protein/NAD(P)-dependent oxidoreductase [Mycolicibacterium austroafricanum]
MTEFGKVLHSSATPIPGLFIWELPVHGDNRGWFKENWQREKMTAAGLPDFGPVQNNVAFNHTAGTTRGIHAEPWDKFVSIASGRVFGAWVDLRAGSTFGTVFYTELDPSRAVFVPRGVGNAYQSLESSTSYIYLVNDHYAPDTDYPALNLADEAVAIPWPIPLAQAEISAKDRQHPRMGKVVPMPPRKILVLGANGQLGSALRREFADSPDVEFATRSDIDLTAENIATQRPWRDYEFVINAAAFTAVDAAETPEGRGEAWLTNVGGTSRLTRIAACHNLTLIHISSDYVFDGRCDRPYREDDHFAPLGVYGQTKAAADHLVATVPRHYIIRTSWVIGDGQNFVRTMLSLAARGADPSVVADQRGRLSFTPDLARAVRHLMERRAPYGTYNLTGSGAVMSWADVARQVFRLSGHDPKRIREVTTSTYSASVDGPIAPRPLNSVLDLGKIVASGFTPPESDDSLRRYVESQLASAGQHP